MQGYILYGKPPFLPLYNMELLWFAENDIDKLKRIGLTTKEKEWLEKKERERLDINKTGRPPKSIQEKYSKFVKNIETEGLPVFTALSPDKKYLAVTFSGKKFPVIQIIDTKTLKIIKRFEFDGKVLHVRWSKEKPLLYVSVNDSNKVAFINTDGWWLRREVFKIKKPSGIFIYEEAK